MVSKEITELRKAGKLKQAFQLAKKELKKDPEDIWIKRAMSWVLYDYLKDAVEKEDLNKTLKILQNIQKLNLSEDEDMFFDNVAWKVGKAVFKLTNTDSVNYQLLNNFYDSIKEFHFPKPSKSYSFLYHSFHNGYESWVRYIEFARWWDFENFMPEDYNNTVYNERKIMSLVEQAYIAYSKKLLEGERPNPLVFETKPDKDLIKDFLPKLDRIIEKHPEYTYPVYSKSKLLLELNENEEALNTVLPFVQRKQKEYWVWSHLADIVTDPEEKIGSLCKALSCNSDPEYLVKVRSSLAELLIKRDLFSEAKTEIEQVVEIKRNNDSKIPNKIQNWIQSEWYEQTKPLRSNESFYKEWAPVGEKILYKTVPIRTVIVEYVNGEKNILNFIDKKKKTGFFNYSGNLDHVAVGDLLDVRFDKKDGEYHTILTAEKSKKESPQALVKEVIGDCRIANGNNFGFIDDTFIPPDVVKKYNLANEQPVKGRAIPSFDKKKGKWGWKLIEIKVS